MNLIDEIRETRIKSRDKILNELFESHYQDVICRIKGAAKNGYSSTRFSYVPHSNSEINIALAVMLFNKLRSEKFTVTQVGVDLTVGWE